MHRSISFAMLAVAACGTVPLAAADDAAPRTNVVVIYADDLGYGDLGCFGHPKFKTPHLDRMAKEGAKLASFYSTCPYCAPARASLMTGRYPFRNGMAAGNINPQTPDLGLPPDEVTLGEAFQQAGYRTICIGKWHLGHQPKFYPTRNGFDEYLGILYSNDMRPVELFENEEKIEYPVIQKTLTERYTQRAERFLTENKDRPFFLYLAHAMPHKPLAASEKFYKQTGTGLYGDVIAELDASVGRVLAKLKELNLDERTLVIFTSDNGPWYGGSTGGLRGMKSTTWDGGLRVPLIARWPGRIPAGHESDEVAIILDLFVTTLAAADVPLPKNVQLDGRDILPLLTSDAKSPHEAILSVSGRVRTIRRGNWKLHLTGTPAPDRRPLDWVDPVAPDGKTILGPKEQYGPADFPGVKTGDRSDGAALFDLKDDPAEQHDLAAEHPEIIRELQATVRRIQEAK